MVCLTMQWYQRYSLESMRLNNLKNSNSFKGTNTKNALLKTTHLERRTIVLFYVNQLLSLFKATVHLNNLRKKINLLIYFTLISCKKFGSSCSVFFQSPISVVQRKHCDAQNLFLQVHLKIHYSPTMQYIRFKVTRHTFWESNR